MAIPSEWEHFKASLGEMSASPILNLRGVSVTIPHKEHALRWCKQQAGGTDVVSEWCGAANTIIFSHTGVTHAFNTDAPAAVAALAVALGMNDHVSAALASGDAIEHSATTTKILIVAADENSIESQTLHQWRQQHVLVLGSGGAARAVIAGLALTGAQVTIANRTHDKAAQLAKLFNARAIHGSHQSRVDAVALEHISAQSFTAIVNCTSAGMTGSGAESIDPLPAAFEIQTGMIVMDTVYRPRETPLLQRARAAGAVVVDGTEMFLRQAALQFALFTKEQIVSETATGNVPQKNAALNINSQIKVQYPNVPIELWRKILNHKLDTRS